MDGATDGNKKQTSITTFAIDLAEQDVITLSPMRTVCVNRECSSFEIDVRLSKYCADS